MFRLKKISEALDPEFVQEYGFDKKSVLELASSTGAKGTWNNGRDQFYPVFVMGNNGKDWYKSKPTAYTIEQLINFIKGSDAKYINREIIGIFPTLEIAKKVYDAIPVREEK